MVIIKFFAFIFCFLWSIEVIPMLNYYQLMIKKIIKLHENRRHIKRISLIICICVRNKSHHMEQEYVVKIMIFLWKKLLFDIEKHLVDILIVIITRKT